MLINKNTMTLKYYIDDHYFAGSCPPFKKSAKPYIKTDVIFYTM